MSKERFSYLGKFEFEEGARPGLNILVIREFGEVRFVGEGVEPRRLCGHTGRVGSSTADTIAGAGDPCKGLELHQAVLVAASGELEIG